MITLTCKSYRARVDGENVVLEIDDAQPMNFMPQLMSKTDVASRLHISIRKVAQIAQSIPVRRLGQPADVARAVLFLAAPESGFITGQVLYVCGGTSVGSLLL